MALSCLGTRGVKNKTISWAQIITVGAIGIVLFFGNGWMLSLDKSIALRTFLYIVVFIAGYLCMLSAGLWMSRLLRSGLDNDMFNIENESFMQERKLIANEYSVNIPTKFWYKKKEYSG